MIEVSSWLVPPRYDQPELLDQGAGTPDDVRASLGDLWRINRYLGGIPALTRHLFPRLRAHTGVVTLADIGTGSAEIPAFIARWARRQHLSVRILALEFAARHLEIARGYVQSLPNVHLVQADARNLPFPRERVDYVTSSVFLHHFPPEEVIELLRESIAIARRGIIMSDGVRGWLPLIAFKIGQPIFARSYITRYDGAASIRRAYTPSELRQLAAEAGLTNARVYRHPLWRMTLVADKT
jgi:hypothetical protein